MTLTTYTNGSTTTWCNSEYSTQAEDGANTADAPPAPPSQAVLQAVCRSRGTGGNADLRPTEAQASGVRSLLFFLRRLLSTVSVADDGRDDHARLAAPFNF